MASTFSLRRDESTDIAGSAVLLIFVWYNYESQIEDLLMCKPLESRRTTGEAIFNIIDSLMEKNPASKVVQIRAALVPVPSPDKWGGLQQEGHPA